MIMKKVSSPLDRLPQPLKLSKRTLNLNPDTTQNPYRLRSEQTSDCKQATLFDMKQQLTVIKDDVQKLFTTKEQNSQHLISNFVPQILTHTLKEELTQSKQLQQRLKRELLRSKSQNLKIVEQVRQTADRKLENIRRDYKEEKTQLKLKVEKTEQTIETLQKNLQSKQQIIAQLRNTIDRSENNNIFERKSIESKYHSSLGEFKKLQQKFIRAQKGDLATVQHRLYEVQQLNSILKVQKMGLQNQKTNLTKKIQRLNLKNSELSLRNSQLQEKVRIKIKNTDYTLQIQQLKKRINSLERQKTILNNNLQAKNNQCQNIMNELTQKINSIKQNKELHKQKLEIFALQVDLTTIKEANLVLIQKISSLKEVLQERQCYIQSLQTQNNFTELYATIKQLEQKCQALVQEKNKLIKSYEEVIAQSSERSFLKNSSFISTTSRFTNNFDVALKQQIIENDLLRLSLKEQSQEIISLKIMNGQMQRKIDAIRNQFQIQKIRIQNQNKANIKNIGLSYDNSKQQLQILKRKQQTLQKKLLAKVEELKDKDQFIQKHLIGKIGREQNQSQSKYLAEQLQKFIQIRLSESKLLYDQSVNMDASRSYKQKRCIFK